MRDGKTYVKFCVPWLAWKVFPRRTPRAEMKVNVRTLITGEELSSANQELPLPSGPAGHRVTLMSSKPASVVCGVASISAFCNGTGTREEEKGEAPAEKGTLGLLVPLRTTDPLPNDVRKEPAKKRLASEALVVMEVTTACAPETPLKGALDQDPALGSKRATDAPGEEKLPAAHTLPSFSSQKRALTCPFGPPDARAAKAPDAGVYEAMLAAETLSMAENEPAR